MFINLLLITYDLRKPDRNYSALTDTLKTYRAERLLESVWLLRTNETAIVWRDRLMQLIDANDGVAVFGVSDSDWGTYNANNPAVALLK